MFHPPLPPVRLPSGPGEVGAAGVQTSQRSGRTHYLEWKISSPSQINLPLLQATIRARNPDAVERCGHKLGLASTLSPVDRRRVNILYSDCPPDGGSTSILQQKIKIIKRLIHRFSSALFNSLNLGNFIL